MSRNEMKHSVKKIFVVLVTFARKNFAGINFFSVTFNVNGGGPDLESQYIVQGGKAVEPPLVAKNGFNFDGWFIDSKYTRRWDFDADRVEADMVLYAKWVAASKNVDLVWVEGGTFVMGNDNIPGAGPAHPVRLNGFYIGKFQITQWEYSMLMADNPSQFQSAETGEHPVDSLTWYEAVLFCNWLSLIEGYDPVYTIYERIPASGSSITSALVRTDLSKNGYRLPTEAEWEYAAKGGKGSPGNYHYSGSNVPDETAWYNLLSRGRTHVVGKKAPNALGLYDMSGNVSEWCGDCFDADYYFNSPLSNPTGPELDGQAEAAPPELGRVRRGGSWNNAHSNVRVSVRDSLPPGNRSNAVGFRVVRRP